MNPARRLAPCGEHATLWTSAAVRGTAAVTLAGSSSPLRSLPLFDLRLCQSDFTLRPCPLCRSPAQRSSARHRAMVAATPWPRPTARASKRRAPHRSSGLPASPWDGSARPPRLAMWSESHRQDAAGRSAVSVGGFLSASIQPS